MTKNIIARASKIPANRNRDQSPADPRRVERAVLGSILLDPALWPQAAQLTPQDFSLKAHQIIFQRMGDLAETGRPIDMITMVEELHRHKQVEAIGDVDYLSSLIDGLPERANVEHYVEMIRRAAGVRAIAHGTTAISELTRKGTNISELRARLTDLVGLASQYETSGAGTILRPEDVPDIYSLDPHSISYIWPDLIPRGAVVLLTGSPGVGKSSFALKFGVACALGMKFLARPCERIECFYLDKENPLMLVRHRMDLIAGGPVSGLHIWGGWLKEEPPLLEDRRLLTWATRYRPLIVFDSLVRFH